MKKNILKISYLLMLMMLSFVLFSSNVSASDDYKHIKNSSGSDVTYKNTNIKVEVPSTYTQKTTEYRGVWVSAYAGDISGFTTTQEVYQNELLSVLDNMEKYNLNTIVFHIRTHNDAFYDTKLAPLSSYMKNANFQKWDSLEWFIEECHNRGIEFHAWLNPYRISSTSTTMQAIKTKYANYRSNPASKEENVLIGKNGAILDPGQPEVREFLIDVCMEVIEKYDVDAIHFDDYFYLDGIDDTATFNKYKSNYNTSNIETFRRLQVDEFIEDLSKTMKDYNLKNNRAVQLGISPSGVYRNGTYNTNYQYDANGTLISPVSSNSTGYSHYDAPLYSDTKKWIDNEWIDYITPQLYGSFENKGMPYADMVDWWSHVVKYKKVNLYTGLGIYQSTGNSDAGWYTKGLKTFENSLLYNQKHEEVDGFCLYQYRTIKNNAYSNEDFKYVFENFLNTPAMNPKSQRYDMDIEEVKDIEIFKGNGNYTVKFENVTSATRYALYKSSGEIDINDASQIVGVFGPKEINTYIDFESSENVNYGIVAINQANELSDLTIINTSQAKSEIDFAFAKIGSITIDGTVEANKYISVTVNKAIIYAGGELTYRIYNSLDLENWNLLKEVTNFNTITQTATFKFNDIMCPTFVKVVVENEFGVMESDIVKVDLRKVTSIDCLDFILKNLNDAIIKNFSFMEE